MSGPLGPEAERINREIAYAHRKKEEAYKAQLELRKLRRGDHGGGPGVMSGKGCLLIVAGLVLTSVAFSAIRGCGNLRATEVIDEYGWGQYLLNFRQGYERQLLVVENGPLRCYPAATDRSKAPSGKPVATLAKGQGLVYRGHDARDERSWIAAQLWQGESPLRCLLLLDEPTGEKTPSWRKWSPQVDPFDLAALKDAQHARFLREAKKEKALVSVKRGNRAAVRRHERDRKLIKVTGWMLRPSDARKGRVVREWFAPRETKERLGRLYSEYLSDEQLERAGASLSR